MAMEYPDIACIVHCPLKTKDPAGSDDGPRWSGLRETILCQNVPRDTIIITLWRQVTGASFLVEWSNPARWTESTTNTLCAHEDSE